MTSPLPSTARLAAAAQRRLYVDNLHLIASPYSLRTLTLHSPTRDEPNCWHLLSSSAWYRIVSNNEANLLNFTTTDIWYCSIIISQQTINHMFLILDIEGLHKKSDAIHTFRENMSKHQTCETTNKWNYSICWCFQRLRVRGWDLHATQVYPIKKIDV